MHFNIPSFKNARVLVVGDLMLDRYWHGPTSRISPEAPVPVVHVDQIEERPGGAGNVALNISRLGANCSVLGLTGDDEPAQSLEKLLTDAGVDACFIRMAGNTTVTKLRIMSRHQQLIRLDFEDGFVEQDGSALLTEFERLVNDYDVIVCSDYGKGCLKNIQAIIKTCRDKNKIVLVDPKGTDFSRYAGASLITPNLSEFEAVAGKASDDVAIESLGEQLRQQYQLGALLVTRSEHGMSLVEDNRVTHMPTQAREVFDVTGAGDTVISTLAAVLASGETLSHATAIANLAAGLVVAKLGTASVSQQELVAASREHLEVKRGVLNESELIEAVRLCQQHGESVVMTNGCFDILHAGHVTYLQQARDCGDRLIVAVNIDETVRQLKGNDRPVNPLEHRMRMLAALECVDWVVPFEEETPQRLICECKPDILVKGGDNDPDKIPGGDCVREAGGEVRVLSYVDGVSTTEIIGSIREKGKTG